MFDLVSSYKPCGDQPAAIRDIIAQLEGGTPMQTMLGVTGSGKTFTMAQVISQTQRPAMIMAPNKTLAAQLYSEMKSFFPNNAVEYFVSYYDYYQPEAYVPATDTYIEKDAAINEHIEQMRLSATRAILQRPDTIIVATVSAIYGLGDPESYQSMTLSLVKGQRVEQRSLIRRLAEMQYVRSDLSFERGQYRVRGDRIDIFPADEEKCAYRIELFDDELESITSFDPLTGECFSQLESYVLYPKTHYVSPKDKMIDVVSHIKEELHQRLCELREQNYLLEAQRLEQRTKYDCEMITEIGYCQGVENYARYISGREAGVPSATLLDYIPHNGLIFLDESHVMIPQLKAMYSGDRSRKEMLVKHGFRLPSALDNRPLKFDEFMSVPFQKICVSATPGAYEKEYASTSAQLIVRPTGLVDPEVQVRPAGSQVLDVVSEIKERLALSERVLITTLTKKMSEQLTEFLTEQGLRVRYMHSEIDTVERVEIIRDLRLGKFDVLVGINLLREGLDMPEVSLVAIFDADKTGFLRSTSALIQTIGRVARHSKGKAILYADKISDAMAQAIDETTRRRDIQKAYNDAHGITPQTILKPINDILEVQKEPDEQEVDLEVPHNPKDIILRIQECEKMMKQHADKLEFEEALRYRQQCERYQELLKG